MVNVFLFTGEEKYLLDKEIERWKYGFIQKHSKESLFVFNSLNFDSGNVLATIFGGGLFSNSKLVIIYGIPLDTDLSNKMLESQYNLFVGDIVSRECVFPKDVIVLFVSNKPDKRSKLYKILTKVAEIKEFKKPSDGDIRKLIRTNLGERTMADGVIDLFIAKVGKDLFRIDAELDKLKWWLKYNNRDVILSEDIDNVVFGQIDVNPFLIFDNLFENKKKAINIIDKMNISSKDFSQLLGIFFWGLKLYIFLIDCYEQGITNVAFMASSFQVSPYVVSKNLANIKTLLKNKKSIHKLYTSLVDIDFNVKTGYMDAIYVNLVLKKLLYKLF